MDVGIEGEKWGRCSEDTVKWREQYENSFVVRNVIEIHEFLVGVTHPREQRTVVELTEKTPCNVDGSHVILIEELPACCIVHCRRPRMWQRRPRTFGRCCSTCKNKEVSKSRNILLITKRKSSKGLEVSESMLDNNPFCIEFPSGLCPFSEDTILHLSILTSCAICARVVSSVCPQFNAIQLDP